MIATKNGPPTMSTWCPDETVRARMRAIRGEIDQDLDHVSASTRCLVAWKHYMDAYPWACLGTAAALGFLIAPKRSTATRGDVAAAGEPAKNGHPVVNTAPTAAHGFVDALVVAAVSVAAREAVAYLGRNARKLLGMDWE
jgi:hypothetical protein